MKNRKKTLHYLFQDEAIWCTWDIYLEQTASTRTQNNAKANTLDLMINWTPPDPRLNQRVYSPEELNENLAHSHSEGEELSPRNF